MTGRTMTTLSIIMVGNDANEPNKALVGVNATFERFSQSPLQVSLVLPKLCFIALNLVSLGIGLWKLDALGLLPTNVPPPKGVLKSYLEYSSPTVQWVA